MDFQLSLQSETIESAHPDAPLAATPQTPVSVVIGLLGSQKSGAVLVCSPATEDGAEKLIGIFTERDALKLMADAASGQTSGLLQKTVGEVMSAEVITANTDATVADAIRLMHQGGYRHVPIVGPAGEPAGAVSVHGIVHYLVEHFPETVYNLPPKADQAQAEREGA